MKGVVIALALALTGCKPSHQAVGEACTADHECDYSNGVWCFEGKCRPQGKEGERCLGSKDCKGYAPCFEQKCVSFERGKQLEAEANARTAEAARKAEAEKEVQLLKESGVTPPPTIAERTTLPAGPGLRVRVVTVTSKTRAFAACRETERLTSGGCRSAQGITASHPSHHGEDDTMGARWNCAVDQHGADVTAFALCTRVQ